MDSNQIVKTWNFIKIFIFKTEFFFYYTLYFVKKKLFKNENKKSFL